jgi:hypothetical protein
LSAVLVALLLAAEAFAVVHPLDADEHASGDPCKICLSVASFGGAAPTHAAAAVIERVRAALPVATLVVLEFVARTRQVARGPPSVS